MNGAKLHHLSDFSLVGCREEDAIAKIKEKVASLSHHAMSMYGEVELLI
jgi:hypothetical protein